MRRSLLPIIGIMLFAGWPSLSMPFRGDEALFAVYAQELSHGSVLYRDYWDITNPGIFCFYFLGGVLFQFTETGIRIFEWLWMTTFVLTVSEAGRRNRGDKQWSLAPALFVGVMYYLAGYSQTATFTKTEGLVAWPLFLAIWLVARTVDSNHRIWLKLILAGMAGGVVILFKLLFAVCLGFAWLALLIMYVRKKPVTLTAVFQFIVGIGMGLCLILGPVVLYFVGNGAGDLLAKTLFELPPKFLAEGQRADMERLALSVKWFLGQYAAVCALAVLSIAGKRDAVTVAMIVALLASFFTILVQRLSWWPYHFLLPGSLAGALAGYSWPCLVKSLQEWVGKPVPRRVKMIGLCAAGVLFLEPLGAGGYQYRRLAQYHFGFAERDRQAMRETTGTAYTEARAEMAWLDEVKAGSIYVCGDPLMYWLGNRRPACRISGWSMELYPQEIRQELAEEIRLRMPMYVYVSSQPHGYDLLIQAKYPELRMILATQYKVAKTTKRGVWYVRIQEPRTE